jgi:hypothetical protein
MVPGQSLIANYQNLGLYNGSQMAILKPRQQMTIQTNFADRQPAEHSATTGDMLIQQGISYYQGAAHVYQNRVNAWSGRNSIPTHMAQSQP